MSRHVERPGKVVCWQWSPAGLGMDLPAKTEDDDTLSLVLTTEPEELLTELGSPGDAIVLLDGLGPMAVELVRNFREQEEWVRLPIYAALRKSEISTEAQDLAIELDVDLLALPTQPRAFWSVLLNACHRFQLHTDQTREALRLRRHKRVSLSVTAFCSVDAQTVNISAGGIQFHTNHTFFPGDRGEIHVPAFKDVSGGRFNFQVVKAETRKGDFQFLVRARFVGMDNETCEKLLEMIQVLEPNGADG